MKQWWTQLAEKEQRLLMLMSVFVVCFLFYHLLWQPVNEGLDKESKKLARHQALLSYVEQHTSQYQAALRSGGNSKATGSLSSIVNRVAKAHQINISRVQPQGDDIQVWIEQVAFNQLLLWLADLTEKNGLQVKTIDISEGNAEGAVNIRRLQLGKM
ncbi:type II secretion system protein M [Thalassotalea atypica]|uniref:type II secretion system protein M n=1 Tax=Thalassotalea atypica TaxID=2054316 RepID=UPI0025734EB0|nr:type II secretion system protein M [Thalassotalea atypica]